MTGMSRQADDLAVHSSPKRLSETYNILVARFGKLTRQRMPFAHCGCQYSRIGDTIRVDQQEYITMLAPARVDKEEKDERALDGAETSVLRSLIGALMWATLTRPDIMAELSMLQSAMNKGTAGHIRQANLLIARTKQKKEASLYYRPMHHRDLRIAVIPDASVASSKKNCAQEGVLVFLMADYVKSQDNHIVATDEFAHNKLSGVAHLLHAQSNRAKRVSYSTSHGETLAAMNGLECATLVSTRLAEITYGDCKPTIQQLLAIQERGCSYLPVDAHTDARDFYELTTGIRSLPQDKSQ